MASGGGAKLWHNLGRGEILPAADFLWGEMGAEGLDAGREEGGVRF